jgi:hypothetical protein
MKSLHSVLKQKTANWRCELVKPDVIHWIVYSAFRAGSSRVLSPMASQMVYSCRISMSAGKTALTFVEDSQSRTKYLQWCGKLRSQDGSLWNGFADARKWQIVQKKNQEDEEEEDEDENDRNDHIYNLKPWLKSFSW